CRAKGTDRDQLASGSDDAAPYSPGSPPKTLRHFLSGSRALRPRTRDIQRVVPPPHIQIVRGGLVMTSPGSIYRSNVMHRSVVGFSVSYEPRNLLERGLGFEHVRELLLRLARPLLRYSASLAYGGNWEDTPENFTYILLRLISAEQEDSSFGGPDTD